MATPAEWILLVRTISSLSAVVLDLVEKVGKEVIDVPTVDKLRQNSNELAALPDLHKPDSE